MKTFTRAIGDDVWIYGILAHHYGPCRLDELKIGDTLVSSMAAARTTGVAEDGVAVSSSGARSVWLMSFGTRVKVRARRGSHPSAQHGREPPGDRPCRRPIRPP